MRWVVYAWAVPNTLLGLVVGILSLSGGGRASLVDGVIEIHGPLLSWVLTRAVPIRGGAAAITLGHVVLARDASTLRCCREHERVHVRQYERWGPAFLPAYAMASLVAWMHGRDPYRDNRFEREAFAADSAS